MDHLRLSRISLSSDSDDLIEDFWFSSPNASFDGSSINSIPWAEDVVKQNQDLWESVERMFYGEQSLPENDEKLRNEIIEWTTRFPYLRIIGKSIQISSADSTANNIPINDDIISVHPPLRSARLTHRPSDDPYKSNIPNRILENDIEKCLRITSGPLLVRRMQNRNGYFPRTANHIEITNKNQSEHIKNPKSAFVCSHLDIAKQFGRRIFRSIDSEPQIPYSAHSVKIPFVKSDSSDFGATNSNKLNLIRIKTATLVPIHRPLRNSITLPSISIEPKYLNHPGNQSISALIYSNDAKYLKRQSIVDKKRSESE